MAVDFSTETRWPSSAVRHRPIHQTRTGVEPLYRRSTRQALDHERPETSTARGVLRMHSQQGRAHRSVPHTDQDMQIAPSTRRGTKIQPPLREPQKGWHPLVWIGLTLLAVLSIWWLTTAFWGWILVHTSDPLTFGPTHGTTITAVIGGGDSQDHPTTLIAVNNQGSVQIIKILASDPKSVQILVITDLVAAGLPDPTNASIGLRDQGNAISMTIYTSVWDSPFHRLQKTFQLSEDGQGNLKLQGTGE